MLNCVLLTIPYNISDQLSAAEEEEGAALYDLVVTVSHVLDARTGGNLVAHIKVGETYHQRKEVSETEKNDFCKVNVKRKSALCLKTDILKDVCFRASHTSSGTCSMTS